MINEKRSKSSSIIRTLEVLEFIANCENPMTPTSIGAFLGIPKPTVHRLVNTLIEEGFVYTNMKGYVIPAERLYNLSLGVLHSSTYKALRRAILEKLSSIIKETCGISVPDGVEMVYYDRVESNFPIRVHLPVGTKVPIWCSASGKLYLSSLETERRNTIIKNLYIEKLARNTITDIDELIQSLEEIKQKGLGIDNEEFIDGMVAISVPIKNPDGKLYACLFCHAPIIRKSLDDLLVYLPAMKEAARELEGLLNH